MTDDKLDETIDRLMDELIEVVDGQPSHAVDIALVEVLVAGAADRDGLRSIMALMTEAIGGRWGEMEEGEEVMRVAHSKN